MNYSSKVQYSHPVFLQWHVLFDGKLSDGFSISSHMNLMALSFGLALFNSLFGRVHAVKKTVTWGSIENIAWMTHCSLTPCSNDHTTGENRYSGSICWWPCLYDPSIELSTGILKGCPRICVIFGNALLDFPVSYQVVGVDRAEIREVVSDIICRWCLEVM